MITLEDKELVARAIELALEAGAQAARVTYNRSTEDLVATLNSKIDRVTHTCDHSMSFALFVDGSYGSFSTNKLSEEALKDFLSKAVQIARTLAADPHRSLPSAERCCHNAITGNELGLVDPTWVDISPSDRLQTALDAAIMGREHGGSQDWQIVSEEGEYSDSLSDVIIMDSDGLCCAHSETSFDYCVETTIECEGEKYSSYAWDSSAFRQGLDARSCGERALQRAVGQIGADTIESGKYNMVVDRELASRMVSPILRALGGYSLQQNNSFLMDSLDKKLFPEGLNIIDVPHIKGQTCSKLFDSEGVATKEAAIIEKGVVKQWFVNTYISSKMGIEPSIEDATRLYLLPYPQEGLDAKAIMKMCGNGIYVTGFNGGNSNAVSGDFSYGVEGFYFENGEIVKPISGMLVTGNFLKLYEGFIAAGSDTRACMSKLIPTLAFCNVDFSGI